MTIPRQNVRPTFVFEFTDVFVVGATTYLRDYSGHDLHAAFPGAGANPTPQTDGSLSFDGGDYLNLPLAFYLYGPTGEYTWVVLFAYNTSITGTFFSTWNGGGGGTHYGNAFRLNTVGAYSTLALMGGGGAVLASNRADLAWAGQERNIVQHSLETTCRAVRETAFLTTTWTAGAYFATVYDATVIPTIGVQVGPANWYTGRMYYLALLPYRATADDMLWISGELREGRKPWCQ